MTIGAIKTNLSIEKVLSHYHLVADRWHRLSCPWHDDKKPSLQIYPKTNTWTCFSTNCTAGSGDVIEFIQRIERSTKHEALQKAKTLINGTQAITMTVPNTAHALDKDLFQKIFTYFSRSLRHSKAGAVREYLAGRGLSLQQEVGYNSGKLHQSKDESFVQKCVAHHLLKPSENGWQSWAKGCLIFPLKSESGEILSFYGRSTSGAGHFYLRNRKGLYPAYPVRTTKTLILTESIIDTATLAQVKLGLVDCSLLALYGTNGLNQEHRRAILELEALEEIIFMLDGDEAGRKAVLSHADMLKALKPGVKLSRVALPEGEDINSLYVAHEESADAMFQELLTQRESVDKVSQPVEQASFPGVEGQLNTRHPELLQYNTPDLNITILGGIQIEGLDRMRVTLKLEKEDRLLRHNLDLYNDSQLESFIKRAGSRLDQRSRELRHILERLTNQLEAYRMEQIEVRKPRKTLDKMLSPQELEAAKNYLSTPNLMQRTQEDLAKTGIIGEAHNRLLMYLCMSSRKRKRPIHVISLAKSGLGKTHLQERVGACIPSEDKIELTTLSDNALYYMQKEELQHKVLIIEDMDGAENVLYPLRELQSKGKLTKTVTLKDNKGRLKTMLLEVQGPISLAGCTTKESLYEDNANRSFLIYLDGSREQDERIMAYQRKLSAGIIDDQAEEAQQQAFQNRQRLLREVAVRNPYAEQLRIPPAVFKPRRTHAHYLAFIEVVTWYHQYQRAWKTDPTTGQRYIETTLEDIEWANRLLAPVLLHKSDELSGACRSFFERLKGWLKKEKKPSFYSKEVRLALRINYNSLKRYLRQLSTNGYLQNVGGSRANGYEYEVVSYEEYQQLQQNIHTVLDDILEKLY